MPKNNKRTNFIINDQIPTKDQLIVDYIKDQLEEKMQASAMDINVICKDGFVHISGFVDVLAEKKAAEHIASQIDGVKKIENKITIAMDSNITDKHMEKEVLQKLQSSKNFNRISGVGVKIEDGVANLMGRVSTLKDAHIAMDIVSQSRGIKDVVNNVEIVTEGQHTSTSISNKIVEEYSKIPLDSRDIHREVSHGTVTLTGYLNSEEEVEMAKEIAMDIEGVKKVINKIKVRKK